MQPNDVLPLKPDAFHILLALLEGPRHGYALMRDLAELSAGKVVLLPGALYRRLQQLLDDGLLEEIDGAGSSSASGGRKRTFAVTPFGRAVAEAEARRLEELVEAARAQDLLKARAGAGS